MKRLVLTISIVIFSFVEIMSKEIYGLFQISNNQNYTVSIKDNIFIIRKISNSLSEPDNVLLNSICRVTNDTLFLNFNGNNYLFKIISNDILISLSDIFSFIKKEDKLQQIVYYCNGYPFLFGNERKNNLKNGKWKYIDVNGKVSGIIFNEGKIIGTYNIETSDSQDE